MLTPRSEGGLGFRFFFLKEWNSVCVGNGSLRELRIPNDRSWNGKKVLKLGSDLGLHMWSTGRGKEKKHLFMVESLAG